jgi:hypothetical protein
MKMQKLHLPKRGNCGKRDDDCQIITIRFPWIFVFVATVIYDKCGAIFLQFNWALCLLSLNLAQAGSSSGRSGLDWKKLPADNAKGRSASSLGNGANGCPSRTDRQRDGRTLRRLPRMRFSLSSRRFYGTAISGG